ncbi:AAA family ATPase [Dictyobacter aurantiacus]|uniref:ATP-binding protein n=1 Tax=Dictyobacter aurantiacus TaxID=1936993 RepID=A0A401ZLJ3_9CHLR|nr:ATP-binding protein [Dictyobacter aurantiacus]GCE07725.1 hypothetical protein KDAU_50540 [Dictyobacter aurantiacus]
MGKPTLIIVNGLPGSGKTTLSRRLAVDVPLPIFSRDGIYETLYDALDCNSHGMPPLLAKSTFTLLYYVLGSVLAGGQSVIVEGFFGRPDLRGAEFRELQSKHDFEPLQILCQADGAVLVERFMARIGAEGRHSGHPDVAWLEENKQRLLQGRLTPMPLNGQIVEVDTTTPDSLNYADLLQRIQTAIQ